jgi:hypothetical protein
MYKILLFMLLLFIPIAYFFMQEKPSNEVIKIDPIVLEKTHHTKSEDSTKNIQPTSNDKIFSQFEKAVYNSKKAASNEEIANNVLMALEKSVHKPMVVKDKVSSIKSEEKADIQTDSVEVKKRTYQAKVATQLPQKEITVQAKPIKKPLQTKKLAQHTVEKKVAKVTKKIETKAPSKSQKIEAKRIVMAKKRQEPIVPKDTPNFKETQSINSDLEVDSNAPKIIFVSKASHGSLTEVNTLIVDTHPEEKLEIYNGSKAYVLDESAPTEEISIDQEEFENLPWSKTYGVVEESENFELKE